MVVRDESGGTAVILLTFALALLMNAIPLPHGVEIFKPDWVALVLIYWVMALPNRIGVFSAWIVGLFVDVLDGYLLGINALSLATIAFIVQLIVHRIRLFSRWKQATHVAILIGIHKLIVLLLSSLIRYFNVDYTYWLSLIGCVIFWPWIFILLRDLRRKYC